jgi:hypothetical protein
MSASEQSRLVSPKPTAKMPGADGLQGLFELAILWAIVWGFPIGSWLGLISLLDAAFPDSPSGLHLLASAVVVVIGMIMLFRVCRNMGWQPAQTLGRYVHKYAFALAVAAGFLAGWFLRV